MRDYQRSAVYRFESGFAPAEPQMDKREARQFFKHVCQSMGITDLAMGFRSGGACSYYFPEDNGKPATIKILWRSRHSILHEIAHHVIHKQNPNLPDHGPEFVATLVAMAIVFNGANPLTVREMGDLIRGR